MATVPADPTEYAAPPRYDLATGPRERALLRQEAGQKGGVRWTPRVTVPPTTTPGHMR